MRYNTRSLGIYVVARQPIKTHYVVSKLFHRHSSVLQKRDSCIFFVPPVMDSSTKMTACVGLFKVDSLKDDFTVDRCQTSVTSIIQCGKILQRGIATFSKNILSSAGRKWMGREYVTIALFARIRYGGTNDVRSKLKIRRYGAIALLPYKTHFSCTGRILLYSCYTLGEVGGLDYEQLLYAKLISRV